MNFIFHLHCLEYFYVAKAIVHLDQEKRIKAKKRNHKTIYACFLNLYKTFHNLIQLVTLSRTRFGWQPLEPIGHDVLGLLIDRGMCFKVISIAEILGFNLLLFETSGFNLLFCKL